MFTVLSRSSMKDLLQETSQLRRSELADAVDGMRESLAGLNPDRHALQRWLRAHAACVPWTHAQLLQHSGNVLDLVDAVARTRTWVRDQLAANDGSSTELLGAMMEVYAIGGYRQFLDDTDLIEKP